MAVTLASELKLPCGAVLPNRLAKAACSLAARRWARVASSMAASWVSLASSICWALALSNASE